MTRRLQSIELESSRTSLIAEPIVDGVVEDRAELIGEPETERLVEGRAAGSEPEKGLFVGHASTRNVELVGDPGDVPAR